MIELTVFTPAYNRAHTIGRTYESLCRQTCKDFKWLVIDDGSTDNTREMVCKWMHDDKGFEVDYVWKVNGGLHTGYNKAIEMAETELIVCIDSDDYMPDDAVEIILDTWHKNKAENLAGIIGLDFLLDNTPIGGMLPTEGFFHGYDLNFRFHHRGDVKYVARVDLLKGVAPMPSFVGEKNFNPSYMYKKIDIKYKWIYVNKNLCFVEYQPDGMANAIFKQYLNSPNSFAAQRINNLNIPAPLRFKLKEYIHLCSSAIIAGDLRWITRAPMPWLAALLLPLGGILAIFIKFKAK